MHKKHLEEEAEKHDLAKKLELNEMRDKHRVELERVKGLSADFADKYEAVLEEKVKFESMLAQEKAEAAGLKSEV